LEKFETGELLSEWSEGDEEKTPPSKLSTEDLLMTTHLKLLNVASAYSRGAGRFLSKDDVMGLREIEKFLRILKRDRQMTYQTSVTTSVLSLMAKELSSLEKRAEPDQDIDLTLLNVPLNVHSSDVLVALKLWADFLAQFKHLSDHARVKLTGLTLEVTRQARKEGNYKLAAEYLQKALRTPYQEMNTTVSMTKFLCSVAVNALPLTVDSALLLRQCAKLCFKEKKEMAVSN